MARAHSFWQYPILTDFWFHNNPILFRAEDFLILVSIAVKSLSIQGLATQLERHLPLTLHSTLISCQDFTEANSRNSPALSWLGYDQSEQRNLRSNMSGIKLLRCQLLWALSLNAVESCDQRITFNRMRSERLVLVLGSLKTASLTRTDVLAVGSVFGI